MLLYKTLTIYLINQQDELKPIPGLWCSVDETEVHTHELKVDTVHWTHKYRDDTEKHRDDLKMCVCWRKTLKSKGKLEKPKHKHTCYHSS